MVYIFEGLFFGSIIQWWVRIICMSGNLSWEVGLVLFLFNLFDGGGGVVFWIGDRLLFVDWEQVSCELSELQFDIFFNLVRDEAFLVFFCQAEGIEVVVYNFWGQELVCYRLDGVQV